MKKLFIALLIAVFATPQLVADEGMWLLQLMRQQNLEEQMRKHGLEMSIDDIYSPDAPSLKDAIGIFGGGCTGEVVSPNGLVLTNHHCGFSFIQQLSTVEHNYLHNGCHDKIFPYCLRPCMNVVRGIRIPTHRQLLHLAQRGWECALCHYPRRNVYIHSAKCSL